MLLAAVAAASQDVAATRSRTAKRDRLAAVLRDASAEELPVVAAWLSGELRQRRTGVGWRSLRDLPGPATEPTLTVREVDAAFTEMAALSGTGSTAARTARLRDLWSRATAPEQRLLAGLVSGELRQGASAGVTVDAVARAGDVPLELVRRALTLHGSLPDVAAAALTGGAPALQGFSLEIGRGLAPMLAATATDLDDAWQRLGGRAAVDWKLDGVRVQVHRDGDDVRVLTRSLDDVTARMPEVVAAVCALPARRLVLDGEALAVDAEGRPRPFQETASRAARRDGVALTPWFFDLLHVDGADLLDAPLSERAAALAEAVPEHQRAPRLVTDDLDAARAFQSAALDGGHEGVVLKALDAPYEAGRRGGAWLKVKPRHTLDLVVLDREHDEVEHGSGRRRGWLSNLHLGARDPAGGFVMLGKTFKGLTDELLRWQTERLRELATDDDGWVVRVRPELVVEIAFDGVQASPRYPGGVALRFARVLRYREDKRPDEADTIDDVRRLHRA
ncbi:MAG TPA: ATP-dependent DNA ligase [Mycobacteriales bacterium]|nr:ATP-dependent DNA ligase [Mycobacteriales bacterium]